MDLSSLNSRQLEAVEAPLGPVLVLAGPGSGKTKTLTYRAVYIIEKKLVHPSNILALTFTNKAAKEMRQRISTLLARFKSAVDQLTMGTFHSVCARVLRKEIKSLGYGSDFVIFDTNDQRKQCQEILEDLRIDTKRMPASLFGALVSRAKNILQLPSELNLGLDSPLADRLLEVYTRYQDALYKQNALDFDDLLMLTVKIFESSPKILEKYRKQFQYILVDEYQDTNLAQYALLKLLAVHGNIFAVGDDAQSIYGFRGSDIRNILNFEKDFPGMLEIKLEQNYRSTRTILDVAQKVIEMNPQQKQKTLWTENLEGEKVLLFEAENERAEGEFVAKKIIQLSTGEAPEPAYDYSDSDADSSHYSILDRFLKARKLYGTKLNNFRQSLLPQMPKIHDSLKEYSVLYRTHAQSRALEEVFIESGIPYQIVGGLKFYERKEIKDMLAYLRLVINFRDLVSLKRVINEPPRGIGDKSYQVIRDFVLESRNVKNQDLENDNEEFSGNNYESGFQEFRQKLSEIKLAPKQWQSTQDFFAILDELSSTPASASLPQLLKKIIKRAGYESFLRDGSEQGETRYENILELNTVASKFLSMPWREAAREMLEEVALISEIDQKDESKDAVTLMTLHSAKGLEFDNVFFVGLEEGILPHSRSLVDPTELSEEIRLAYVGLTRARKRLFLVFASARRVFGDLRVSSPSRVLKVLPRELIDFQGTAKGFWQEDDSSGNLAVEEVDFSN
ncbi:MAG: UvrD-helicase domain-containing protein [Candidatus Doudnabacteria bacterium]|nr:UvrD-helicase domain-containing protein [Candidatus Doudnabacteria bacterium]